MDTADRVEMLRASKLFRMVPEPDLRAFAESLRVEQFRKGETICEADDVADRIFLIASGTVEVRLAGDNRHRPQFGAGEIIGEFGLFTRRRTATVVSLTDSTVLSLDNERFRNFLHLFPSTTYALLGETVNRLLATENELRSRRRKPAKSG